MGIMVDRHWGPPMGESEITALMCTEGLTPLGPADRLVLPPHTPHAATVSAEEVRCIEASAELDAG